jgi:hydrogenase expression/formation protein HypC
MCIGVPGQVVSVGESVHHLAQVDVCGVRRDVNIMLVCESEPAAAWSVGAGARGVCHERN